MFFSFGGFPIIFGLAFAAILVVIAVVAAKGLGQWHKNNQSPVLTVQAEVTGKRRNDSTSVQQMGEVSMPMTDTTYYATFQVPSGDRMELRLSGKEYGQLREGDRGELTFQGTRYLMFERRR